MLATTLKAQLEEMQIEQHRKWYKRGADWHPYFPV